MLLVGCGMSEEAKMQLKSYYLKVVFPNKEEVQFDINLKEQKSDTKARETLEDWDVSLHKYYNDYDLISKIFANNDLWEVENYIQEKFFLAQGNTRKDIVDDLINKCDVYLATKRDKDIKLAVLYYDMALPLTEEEVLEKLTNSRREPGKLFFNEVARTYGECARQWEHGFRNSYERNQRDGAAWHTMFRRFPEKVSKNYRLRRDLTVTVEAIKKHDKQYLEFAKYTGQPMTFKHRDGRVKPMIISTRDAIIRAYPSLCDLPDSFSVEQLTDGTVWVSTGYVSESNNDKKPQQR